MRAFCTVLIVGAVIGSPSQVRAASELVNGINAVVHDSVVTLGEVDIMTLPAQEVLIRQYRNQPEVYVKKLTDARSDSLEQLLERQLILTDFKATFNQADRQAIIDKEINKEVDQEVEAEIRTRYGGNRMTLIQTLQAQGITLERHRQQIRDRIIISWLRQKNISSELIVSPHRVEVYYQAHREEFKVQEEVKLRMIVLKCPGDNEASRTERLTEDILTKLREGATFTEMATIHSEGSQRGQGGDLGWQEVARLNKHLGDTAASLQAGQHSGVMSRSAGDDYWVLQYDKGVPTLGRHYVADTTLKKETMVEERRFENASAATNLPPPTEFYIMLVEDKRPQRFNALGEVREKIEKDLLAQERSRVEKQWVDKLKKKTFVRVF
jgi:peptidyl-prolyl cis-trans isomerase SurA